MKVSGSFGLKLKIDVMLFVMYCVIFELFLLCLVSSYGPMLSFCVCAIPNFIACKTIYCSVFGLSLSSSK